jgi:retron-type reverse transcriptase
MRTAASPDPTPLELTGQQNPRRWEGPLLRSCVTCTEGPVSCHMARTTKQDKVRELQRTLCRAAKADPGRRFHALYDKIYRRDVLERAWELVRANRGVAGIDRQTIADVEQYGVSRLLDDLAADLKDGRWRPLPARRVFIAKPGRPQERRPLSIPAVRDRVVEAATKTVIEPIFEADMLECSFGFGIGRRLPSIRTASCACGAWPRTARGGSARRG